MLENLGKKTPEEIINVTSECFALLNEFKSVYRDKKSREYFEKIKWAEGNIKVLTGMAKEQKSKPLDEIVIDGAKLDYKRLKDELFNLMFLFLKLKNENIKLSDRAKEAAEILNNKLCVA